MVQAVLETNASRHGGQKYLFNGLVVYRFARLLPIPANMEPKSIGLIV